MTYSFIRPTGGISFAEPKLNEVQSTDLFINTPLTNSSTNNILSRTANNILTVTPLTQTERQAVDKGINNKEGRLMAGSDTKVSDPNMPVPTFSFDTSPTSKSEPTASDYPEIKAIANYAKCTQNDLDIPKPNDINIKDLGYRNGEKVLGLTQTLPPPSGFDIDKSYTKPLSTDAKVDLFNTIVHESVHVQQSWFEKLFARLGTERVAREEADKRTAPLADKIKRGDLTCP